MKPKVIEVSLCKFCGYMTETISKQKLSASENKHYRYECNKCGAKKNLELITRIENIKTPMKCDVCFKTHKRLHMVCISKAITEKEMQDHWTCEKEIKVCKNCKEKINFRDFGDRFKD